MFYLTAKSVGGAKAFPFFLVGGIFFHRKERREAQRRFLFFLGGGDISTGMAFRLSLCILCALCGFKKNRAYGNLAALLRNFICVTTEFIFRIDAAKGVLARCGAVL